MLEADKDRFTRNGLCNYYHSHFFKLRTLCLEVQEKSVAKEAIALQFLIEKINGMP